MVGSRLSAEIVTYCVFARNVVTKQPRTVNYECSGSLRVASDDKIRCKSQMQDTGKKTEDRIQEPEIRYAPSVL